MSENILAALKKIVGSYGIPSRARNIVEALDEISIYEGNPLTVLTVDTEVSPSEDLLGKVIGDLQSDVVIGGTAITGELAYVDDYTGFSGVEEEQSGHYLVLHITVPDVTGATIKAGINKLSTLDSDGIIIIRVAKLDKPVRIEVSKDGAATILVTYDISGLTLAAE